MNKMHSITFVILTAAIFCFGCRQNTKVANDAETSANAISLQGEKENYVAIDTRKSVVTWKGKNLIGSNAHMGYVHISKGELLIENGQLMGGSAEIDMNTIEDDKHSRKNGLVDHLKDPDFFDVAKYPTAAIVLHKAEADGENAKVSGSLTIKSITQPVSFPAKLEVSDGIFRMKGNLVIDRTKWNVRYKSGKFYDLLADQTISDSIAFHVDIASERANK
ncbi:YceI family protein [Flavobacterium sp.]|uniref:YceI family protein n=1 Tax=Flavobacterium sp. TaxID=239 RepID=UPI0025BFEBBD|nr:YceI family protein [Flavobacterium sp.]